MSNAGIVDGCRGLLSLGLTLWAATGASAAPSVDGIDLGGWREITAPTFTLLSDMEKKRIVELAKDLLRFVEAARNTTNIETFEPQVPIRIIVFEKKRDFGRFTDRRGGVGGLIQDRDPGCWTLVTYEGRDLLENTFHEYSHYLFRNSGRAYPRWFDEGFAELISTMSFTRGKALLGRAPVRRLLTLQSHPGWIPVERLVGIRQYPKSEARVDLFYAEGWLLAHYLHTAHLFGEDRLIEAMTRYFDLLHDGARWRAAYRETFPISVDELDARLRRHRDRVGARPLVLPAVAVEIGEPDTRALSLVRVRPARVARMLGESSLMLSTRGPDQAERFLEISIAREPDDARSHANLALAHALRGDLERAETAAARAKVLDAKGVRVLGAVGAVALGRARAADPLDREQLAVARRAYWDLIENHPNSLAGYLGLGRSYVAVDDDPRVGIEALLKARSMLVGYGDLDLAKLYLQSGRARDAYGALWNVLRWEAGSRSAEEAEVLLEELRRRLRETPAASSDGLSPSSE